MAKKGFKRWRSQRKTETNRRKWLRRLLASINQQDYQQDRDLGTEASLQQESRARSDEEEKEARRRLEKSYGGVVKEVSTRSAEEAELRETMVEAELRKAEEQKRRTDLPIAISPATW